MPKESKRQSPLRSGQNRATAADVARAAGVSVSAVSRVFTPGKSIAQGTKARVLRAADALGYQPNPLARGLITRRSGMVAILMAEVSNPFYPTVLETFARALSAQGKHVMLFTPGEDEPLEALLPRAFDYGVEGVVITSAKLTSEMMSVCANAPVPVVLFNRTVEGADVSAVCCDNEAGGRSIARFLVQGGRRRAAFVAGLEGASTSLYRERGFAAGLAEAGLPAPLRAQGGFTFDGGLRAATELLALAGRSPSRRHFRGERHHGPRRSRWPASGRRSARSRGCLGRRLRRYCRLGLAELRSDHLPSTDQPHDRGNAAHSRSCGVRRAEFAEYGTAARASHRAGVDGERCRGCPGTVLEQGRLSWTRSGDSS